ncbi:type II toxin-antitoxin system PemK/MazF family toxin [Saccharibacillus sp. CPCC 101409]|uniref:type II toxin-antitoxin system PemK/MazF family toxin n=1 Tax=Saccharibacillus sp. CPCC 101409 TaxID=3058041 RepID=UPI0026718D51|nr:type II toxin-antitoxin system PemK/MazF family toxin [Saccharibacillus sp. CPCC 101409]MDO3409861.1 type II toxin-antitoxin system PemK/MazF family toxin [Saccharibacillus sp. CPCC 101409]
MQSFKRGYVAKAKLPKTLHTSETPEPGFAMHGEHFVILLHDDTNPDIDSRSALVMPITSARAEVKKAARQNRQMLLAYVPIDQARHPFLEDDSYVSTGQVMPINRAWLDQYVGEVHTDTMEEIDLQAIQNLGLMSMALKLGEELYKGKLEKASDKVADEQLNRSSKADLS